MRVLLIGSGGREHALALGLMKSPKLEKLFCLPGNAGIGKVCELVSIKQNDNEAILAFIKKNNIDFIVVGPEQPLADGLVNILVKEGFPAFGPTKEAAELESSKAFAKYIMAKYNIPTAGYKVFSRSEKALLIHYLKTSSYPLVIKADGLAAGKGVVIPSSFEEAADTIKDFFDNDIFGSAGDKVVIEEFLQGEEASVFAVSDGENYAVLSPAQDHKRVFDNDEGKNTGGMGSYAPAPVVTPDLMKEIEDKVIKPTIAGMKSEGKPFVGCLYCGLMITADGPKVIEYNCRFGDPETQVVLPLIESDLLDLLYCASSKSLENYKVKLFDKSAVCVVLASGGYPDKYETGKVITGLDSLDPDTIVYHAGTKMLDEKIVTSGGRVLGVTKMADDLQTTINNVYLELKKIKFEGMHFRTDIGKKGLKHFEG